ncbi:MAG: DNA/RNA non-specific endonuclease [Lachnospiraceae bacterium]|nr:DNA/RNA non-specific endonuclease [Lachnospiraceae bacterium]
MLYYFHILSDYLSDDNEETATIVYNWSVPSYCGVTYVDVNGNKPCFTSIQKKNTISFAYYAPLDSLGRAGVAFGNIGLDIMPASNSRSEIGHIKPSGWNQNKYKDIIGSATDAGNLYNRCHLIAHRLAGEDEEQNLITGTRYLNEAMIDVEKAVADYVTSTSNHVLYRVTPVFKGDNLVASGVQIEAYSVEDSGKGICFNKYFYNVQPGIAINYANGQSEQVEELWTDDNTLQFAVYNASETNTDWMFELGKHMEIVFDDLKDSYTYTSMKSQLNSIAENARKIQNGETSSRVYIKLKQYEYQYLEVLKTHIPLLLKKELFFASAYD